MKNIRQKNPPLVNNSLANPPHCFIILPTIVSSLGSIISNSRLEIRGLSPKQHLPISGPHTRRISLPPGVLTEYRGDPYFCNCCILPSGFVPSVTVTCCKFKSVIFCHNCCYSQKHLLQPKNKSRGYHQTLKLP